MLSAPSDPRNGTFNQTASANLNQSLPIAAALAAPEILGVGNMAAGATLGAGFDAAGHRQYGTDHSYPQHKLC